MHRLRAVIAITLIELVPWWVQSRLSPQPQCLPFSTTPRK